MLSLCLLLPDPSSVLALDSPTLPSLVNVLCSSFEPSKLHFASGVNYDL